MGMAYGRRLHSHDLSVTGLMWYKYIILGACVEDGFADLSAVGVTRYSCGTHCHKRGWYIMMYCNCHCGMLYFFIFCASFCVT